MVLGLSFGGRATSETQAYCIFLLPDIRTLCGILFLDYEIIPLRDGNFFHPFRFRLFGFFYAIMQWFKIYVMILGF